MALPTVHGEARIIGQPEMRHTPQGKAVLQLRAVMNRRRFNEQTNEWENTAEAWLNLALWEKLAERNEHYLNDKDTIVFEGELETRSFDRKDGTKGLSVDVRVDKVAKVAPFQSSNGQSSQGFQAPAGQFRQPVAAGSGWGGDDSPPF